MDAALAGLIGAAIGSTSAIGVAWVQAHYLSKREKAKVVLDAAMAHRREAFDYAAQTSGEVVVLPLAVHVHYQQELMKMIERGDLTKESFGKLHAHQDELIDFIREDKLRRVIGKSRTP